MTANIRALWESDVRVYGHYEQRQLILFSVSCSEAHKTYMGHVGLPGAAAWEHEVTRLAVSLVPVTANLYLQTVSHELHRSDLQHLPVSNWH